MVAIVTYPTNKINTFSLLYNKLNYTIMSGLLLDPILVVLSHYHPAQGNFLATYTSRSTSFLDCTSLCCSVTNGVTSLISVNLSLAYAYLSNICN